LTSHQNPLNLTGKDNPQSLLDTVHRGGVMNYMRYQMFFCLLFLASTFYSDATAQEPQQKTILTGSIRGYITDAVTHGPVSGASVTILDSHLGDATDSAGLFVIENVPVGRYILKITSIAYHPQSVPDVNIGPGKATNVAVTLNYRPLEMRGTSVRGSYFTDKDIMKPSTMELSNQEIKRSPGFGDISRIISIHPGVSAKDDRINTIIVRGGSPVENGFYVNNIEIPNINHFQMGASTGGWYGIIEGDFIQNATLSAGGFSAAYGDRLSSITEITIREGNREEFEGRVDANFAGVAAAAEGPLMRGKASWLLSIRQSYLQFMADKLDPDFTPNFSDLQGRLLFDVSPRNRLSLLFIMGQDQIDFDKERGIEGGHDEYGKTSSGQFTVGINWRHLYGSRGYSNTSLAFQGIRRSREFLYIVDDRVKTSTNTNKHFLRLRHITVFRLGEWEYLKSGIDAKICRADYDFLTNSIYNPLGGVYPAGTYEERIESGDIGAFVSLTLRPLNQLNTTLGLRYDYFDYTARGYLSPRLSFALGIADNTILTGAIGIYQQCLPLGMYGRDEAARLLKDPVAYHYILGINRLVTETVKLTLEGYIKRYNFFPLDARQPRLFILDGLLYWDYLGYYRDMVDAGKAKSYGIELTFQKRLTGGFYGIFCGSYSRSQYLGLDGVWRNRVLDNRLSLAAETGYRPGNNWQFSIRWTFSGGPAYTPFDLEESFRFNMDIYDMSRINDARYPDYHMLTLRMERQFHFRQSSLSVYLELYNLYNRRNVYQYYWNERDRGVDSADQYGFVPLLGLKMEF
jgi:hypothetical protein